MKKFLIILCVLLMLPLYSFSAKSPTIENIISCNPALMFTFAEKMPEWETILYRLEVLNAILPEHTMLDAFKVYLDHSYENVKWTLSIPITKKHELQVLIIDAEAVYFQEPTITSDGNVIIDFTNYEPGVYYVCFYIVK